jgi:basic amino acid/polyamine antiporter, APA family
VDTNGNLLLSILITGVVCTLIALVLPFANLNDMISAGVLVSFNMTNSALIFLRRDDRNRAASNFELTPPIFSKFLNRKTVLRDILILYHVLSVMFAFIAVNFTFDGALIFLLTSICGALFFLSFCLYILVSPPSSFEIDISTHYLVPYVPFTPLLGIFVNYCLIAQLSSTGLMLITTYILCAVIFYYSFGYTYSIGNNSGWKDLMKSSGFSSSSNADEDAVVEFSPSSSSYQMASSPSSLLDESNGHAGFFLVTTDSTNASVGPRYTAVRTTTISSSQESVVEHYHGAETDDAA